MKPEFPYRDVDVLVLGAAGFVGRWVARQLSTLGARLTLSVRNESSARPIFERWAISGETVVADLSSPRTVGDLIEAYHPQVTFNLAGYGVDRSEQDPELGKRINTELPIELAAAIGDIPAEGWTGQRLVHVGSAFEYGMVGGDLSESGPAEPSNWYGETKLAATRALSELCTAQKLPALTARLFTVYGPGEHSGRLLPSLMAAARSGQSGPLSSGTQQRDFTYVGDVAEGLLRLGAIPAGQEIPPVVNLATGKLHSVRQFVEAAAEILEIPDENLQFGAIPPRGKEMEHDPVNIERLKSVTTWSPATTIAAGIRQTWDFETGL